MICDPCSGSGGFLIRAFEYVRTKIEEDVQGRKDVAREKIEALGLSAEKERERINAAFAELNRELEPDQNNPPSRIYRLAHNYIYGTDAEVRAARTSKMNMIMHGDGHGGIHYHDGLLDINGIFPNRFDIVLTNPPFGSNVGEDQKVGSTEQTRVPVSADYIERCLERYKEPWKESHDLMVQSAKGKLAILDLFEIGKDKPNRPTEIVFVERCLKLLRPGGRMGIVLPDGNLNNPSLSWLRRWAEGTAKLLAVVSLPEDTFKSADASVKASLVFMQKFTQEDTAKWEEIWNSTHSKLDGGFATKRTVLCAQFSSRIATAEDDKFEELLDKLALHGITRKLPEWRLKTPPAYPRGVIQSEIGKPKWEGIPKSKEDKKAVRILREEFDAIWSEAHEERAEDLRRELRAALRRIDREHSRALWAEVRVIFDYPVFTAAPETVGITSTGADGPTDLPKVLEAWRAFDKWMKTGAKESQIPKFVL